MKRKWVGVSAILVFLSLFMWARSLVSWRPKLVASHVKGIGDLDFSRDGQILRVELDFSKPLFFYADSWQLADDSNQNVRFGSRLALWPHEKDTAISVCTVGNGNCAILQGAKGDEFFFQPCHFGFSSDDERVFLVTPHKFCAWSKNGKLLFQTVSRPALKDAIAFWLAPNGSRFAISVLSKEKMLFSKSKTHVFEARSEKKLFSWSYDSDFNRQLGFSPDDSIFWRKTESSLKIQFRDAQTGRFLWSSFQLPHVEPAFLPQENAVVLFNGRALEIRDARRGTLKRQIVGPSDISQIAVAPDGLSAWTSHRSGEIWSWRLK